MTRCAVLQAKRGIGDVIWHLPFVRSIAAATAGGKVTFLAPPSSGAAELLAGEPSVVEVLYFEHHGSELRRGINLIKLAALLRRNRFDTLWVLDRTVRPALAGFLAGVPERIGLGFGAQRWFITNRGIDRSHFHDHPIACLRVLMAEMALPLPSTEPELEIPNDRLAAVGAKFRLCPQPWILIGLGAFDPERDWPDDYWIEFLTGVRKLTSGGVFLIGGGANADRAQSLITRSGIAGAVNACTLTLGETAALLRHAALFIGPDSGPMNIAAAVGTPAFGLFGVNPVLNYSRFIQAITPEGGPAPGGMRKIAPAVVLARIQPCLPVAADTP